MCTRFSPGWQVACWCKEKDQGLRVWPSLHLESWEGTLGQDTGRSPTWNQPPQLLTHWDSPHQKNTGLSLGRGKVFHFHQSFTFESELMYTCDWWERLTKHTFPISKFCSGLILMFARRCTTDLEVPQWKYVTEVSALLRLNLERMLPFIHSVMKWRMKGWQDILFSNHVWNQIGHVAAFPPPWPYPWAHFSVLAAPCSLTMPWGSAPIHHFFAKS